MTKTGADLFVETLEQYGVTQLFGNPGTTELPIMRALSNSSLSYQLALHEDIAVGMAAGYASTRRYLDDDVPVGVVNLHVAPGLAHGLGNLHGAKFAGAPVVVTAGTHSTGYQHEEPILSGDLVQMTQKMAKWSAEIKDVSAIPSMLRRAFRIALTPPTGPVFLALPFDVMNAETADGPERLGPIPTLGTGDNDQISKAVDLVLDADEPIMVLGDRVAQSGEDAVNAAVRFAETSGVRVYGEILMGEVNFPTIHEQWVSTIAPSAGRARELMKSDSIIFVGCSTHTPDIMPDESLLEDDTDCIHIGDSWEVGKNYPADAAIIGDPGAVLDQLADRLEPKIADETVERRKETARSYKELYSLDDPAPADDQGRASKGKLIEELQRVAPDAFLVNEAITTARELRNRWDYTPETMISNKSGGLGYGLPATLGAAIAYDQSTTDRPVVGIVGDGSYLYYPQALYTAARYDIDVTVVIPNNMNYNILKVNMDRLFDDTDGEHDYIGMDFDPPFDLCRSAEANGATAQRVETDSKIESAIRDAIDDPGPVVVDVWVHDE